jgi:hypothetical protein
MSTAQQEAATTISLTLDCADPERLANFWNQALGYQQVAAVDNFVVLAPLPAWQVPNWHCKEYRNPGRQRTTCISISGSPTSTQRPLDSRRSEPSAGKKSRTTSTACAGSSSPTPKATSSASDAREARRRLLRALEAAVLRPATFVAQRGCVRYSSYGLSASDEPRARDQRPHAAGTRPAAGNQHRTCAPSPG